MRITYIHQHFRTPAQAGGTRSWEFARRLVQEGHAVTVICGGDGARRHILEGVEIVQLSARYQNRMGLLRRIVAFLVFMTKSAVFAARCSTDVVLASSTPLTVAVPGLVGSCVRRVPLVFEVRDLWPDAPIELGLLRNRSVIFLARMLERIVYARAARIIALSPGMADGVRRIAPQATVAMIPNACDFQLFDTGADERCWERRDRGWRDGEIVLIYAGSFGRAYGLEWVIEVAGHLPAERFRVIVVGEGASTATLRTRARELGLEVETVLPGQMSKKSVARLVGACDAVLSSMNATPFLEMNSLNKVFDAMAASKPIFFNHGGWLAEAVTQAGGGWVLSRDPAAAAFELGQICGSRSILAEAGTHNYALGRAKFDRDELFSNFRSVLESAIGVGAAPGDSDDRTTRPRIEDRSARGDALDGRTAANVSRDDGSSADGRAGADRYVR